MSPHRIRAWLLTTAIACAPLLLAQPAAAQDTDQRIADIEAQIKALQGQLQQVTRALHDAQAQVQSQRQAQQAPRAQAKRRSNVAQTPAPEINPAPLAAGTAPRLPAQRDIFSGVGGGKGTDDNMALVSFRYIPFQ